MDIKINITHNISAFKLKLKIKLMEEIKELYKFLIYYYMV